MSNTIHEFVTAYNQLYEIMRGVCLEAYVPLYTTVAMREILGTPLYYTLESLDTIRMSTAQLKIFLEHGNFECDCPDNEVSPVCFACNVDAASKNIIQARAKLERQGLVSE